MKVNYINILLFALPLNILINAQKNPSITQKIPTTRLLCVCELYEPANYDNDPEMKSVMDNFNKQTQQRFHEYDERMKTTRQKCKDRCDKEIQKIILKDKIEKLLAQLFYTLQTNIDTADIPTCACEKSLAYKVERSCLICGKNLGGLVPGLGLIGGTSVYAAGVNAATKAGMEAAIEGLKIVPGLNALLKEKIADLVTATNFKCPNALVAVVQNVKNTQCVGNAAQSNIFCNGIESRYIPIIYQKAAAASQDGSQTYITTLSDSTTITTFLTYPIVISAIVVVTIALILLIIYLILRYRRKTKMNKKLQYIKILKT
ncbi:rifin [Plasmodium reichenowi]|uniref:Rifin n=1 Tax=Plasmodium reichenowi TaxID=5854 RepID=A0A060RMA1_PLARE|nr:rifin [Plasmodium reichenowi]